MKELLAKLQYGAGETKLPVNELRDRIRFLEEKNCHLWGLISDFEDHLALPPVRIRRGSVCLAAAIPILTYRNDQSLRDSVGKETWLRLACTFFTCTRMSFRKMTWLAERIS